jgi:hypothetical protein
LKWFTGSIRIGKQKEGRLIREKRKEGKRIGKWRKGMKNDWEVRRIGEGRVGWNEYREAVEGRMEEWSIGKLGKERTKLWEKQIL